MKNFGKYILLILAFLSIGEASACGYTSSEIRQELPLSSEDLRAVNLSLFASRLNPFQDIPDLSKNHYFATQSVLPNKELEAALSEEVKHFYNRDIRKDISKQIFPTHIFL